LTEIGGTNLIDIEVSVPGDGGDPSLVVTPESELFAVVSEVTAAGEGEESAISDSASGEDPSTVVVTGSVAPGATQLTVFRIEDSVQWARTTLFIEALGRAGVEVAAPTVAPNDESGLPATGTHTDEQQVASLESPPLSAMGNMVPETSYNTGANAFLCLLAVEAGSVDCDDGLATIYDLADEAGAATNHIFLIEGQGGDSASVTSRQISIWNTWARQQPWGEVFVDGQPVLGESGSLAPQGADSPAADGTARVAASSVLVELALEGPARTYVR
jgi:D-alanyl-D-alanine carboxypeptidase/D-alanyl-D-alanine-endopeptidase (penicillin-binding protein 4)